MRWSPEQDRALSAVSRWLRRPDDPVFRLFGFAGTGKTTLARTIAEAAGGTVLFGAFTGKAASVMRRKGCAGAQTLHSLVYRFDGQDAEMRPTFTLNPESDLADASLLILDECSMVNEALGRDVLSFGVPVLVLGDPMQLPPVAGAGFFGGDPEVMLTEIHRQARDNPIIALATAARTGRPLSPGPHGDSRVLGAGERPTPGEMAAADRALVGTHASRMRANAWFRRNAGREGTLPAAGESAICLRNNRRSGVLNGTTWTVLESETRGRFARLRLRSDDGPQVVEVDAPLSVFGGTQVEVAEAQALDRRRYDLFDFGYALTVHKAQGSQWDDVLLLDESDVFGEGAARHLYTAITRAAQRITISRDR